MPAKQNVAFFWDWSADKQIEQIPKGWKVDKKWVASVKRRVEVTKKTAEIRRLSDTPKPKWAVCDPSKLRR
ncbi:Oidioi.mRNA.OKI2018_I69.chr2.g7780.t1.cds [Oikopleura dioica]|uniref:Oidioi.mRNA.OKI2018_I69.chr2.g7780.t1.cds n=1 Tax=Oikopleura dioica TaxID=34765 RepID=A0ABN7TDT8_OIKDI|nr:Oidioi.mRNA.OKI2018_I69.chr2.g7780.t1.cds [Oikopleura dioica]